MTDQNTNTNTRLRTIIEIADRLLYLPRVAYEGILFFLLIPTYVAHEAAHAIATIPWGGPSGAYLIYDESRRGFLANIPIGAAIVHNVNASDAVETMITMAPLGLLALSKPLVQIQISWVQAVGIALFIAGILAFGDLIKIIDADLYTRMFHLKSVRYKRVIDFTAHGFGNELEPPASATREDLQEWVNAKQ